MAVSFENLATAAGLKQLDEYLLTRSYISGYEASKDDLAVYVAVGDVSSYPNVARWASHIKNLLGSRFAGAAVGVSISGGSASAAGSAAPAAVPVAVPQAASKPAADEEDDDDLDLFSEQTEEEKAAAAEREAAAKAKGKKAKEVGKSSVLLDVKPWDDETDMVKLEAAVRSITMEGLTWGASKLVPLTMAKLVPVGYGIKKLTIMMTIVDDLVSPDNIIEDHLTVGDAAEFIQSCDIVAFNKICKPMPCAAPGVGSADVSAPLLCPLSQPCLIWWILGSFILLV